MQLHQPDALDRLVVSSSPSPTSAASRTGCPTSAAGSLDPAYAERGVAPPADAFARTRYLADPDRAAYHAYGLGRNSMLRVYSPHILWRYVTWALRDKPIGIRDDTLQRGGDFVVGRDGRLTLSHRGRDQSERPSPDAILAALRQG